MHGNGNDERNDTSPNEGTRDIPTSNQLDIVYDCLRSARSRYLLYYLCDNKEAVIPVEEAIEAVQEYEGLSLGTDELPPRQAMRINLLHQHLPRLQAAGVVTHDPQRGEIQFKGNPLLEEWVKRSRELELK